MKFTKTLAAIAAASLAVSSLAVSAFAAAAAITSNSAIDLASDNKADAVIKLYEEDKEHKPVIDLFTEKNVARSDVYGVKLYFDLTADQVNGEDWIGGGVGANSESTGWLGVEWGQEGGKKPIILAEDGTVTWLQDKPVFADTDTYCQLWAQTWSIDLTLEKMEVLDKDGKAIEAISDVEADEPADTDTKPAEPKPIQTKAEIAAVNSKEPSYTYTVKGDIDTLKVDVAVSPNEEDKSFEWNDWCGAGVIVKNPDGTTKYYQWGGAQVSWGWDATGDKEFDSIDGVNGKTWVGTVSGEDRSGQLSIPVVKGSVVEFYCLSWVDDKTGEAKYTKTQYTLTINDEEVAADNDKTPDDDTSKEDPAKPGDSTVPGDSTIPGDSTVPGETEVPVEPGKSDKKPADDNKKPANPDAGVAVAVVPTALAAAAVAAAGIVLKKRSK